MTPEINAKIFTWRQRCVDGTITEEQLTEAMAALRGERKTAAATTKAAKAKAAKAAIPSAKSLLDEMEAGDE